MILQKEKSSLDEVIPSHLIIFIRHYITNKGLADWGSAVSTSTTLDKIETSIPHQLQRNICKLNGGNASRGHDTDTLQPNATRRPKRRRNKRQTKTKVSEVISSEATRTEITLCRSTRRPAILSPLRAHRTPKLKAHLSTAVLPKHCGRRSPFAALRTRQNTAIVRYLNASLLD